MLSLFVGLAFTLAAPGVKEPPKKDTATLVGHWTPESAMAAGMAIPIPKEGALEFTADGKAIFRENGAAKDEDGTFTHDAKKSPAEIDLVEPRGAGAKKPMLGIYKIDGDTLTLCISMTGDRPTKFESPVGGMTMLMTLKRTKK